MDKYERIKVVGRGAYGTVYLCRRLSDREEVIIKQVPVDQMSKQQRISALNEAIVLSMLNHPNITRYYENFLEDKALMIVMEYAEGGTVFDYLQQRDGKLLSEEEILRFFVQLLLSLQHVHYRQILHRDLKTQNLLLDSKKQLVKISDFGISKVMSKSKAFTVVGTPCYISPELCESKPYNQKSDIWSLGCVLYEFATLQKAFEAPTLPALILKIMRGSTAPIDTSYSQDLKDLVADMLQVDPSKRPSASMMLASPLLLGHLISHTCDFGALPCIKYKAKAQARRNKGVVGVRRRVRGLSEVWVWGVGNNWNPSLLPLPTPHTQITQVSIGRTQKAGVSKSGRVVLWDMVMVNNENSLDLPTLCPPSQPSSSSSSPPSSSSLPPSSLSSAAPSSSSSSFTSSYLEGHSSISITQVSCGHLYISLLTDRGILMTVGCGSFGCLGHGDYNDVAQAKIVEALLGYEVTEVSAGNSHVVVLSSDNEVFTWGRGDNGRLGLSNTQCHCSPQLVSLPSNHQYVRVHAGVDRTIIITAEGRLLVTGSNRWNKLAIDDFPESSIFSHVLFSSSAFSSLSPPQTSSLSKPPVQLSSSPSSSSRSLQPSSPLLQRSSTQQSSLILQTSSSSSPQPSSFSSPSQLPSSPRPSSPQPSSFSSPSLQPSSPRPSSPRPSSPRPPSTQPQSFSQQPSTQPQSFSQQPSPQPSSTQPPSTQPPSQPSFSPQPSSPSQLPSSPSQLSSSRTTTEVHTFTLVTSSPLSHLKVKRVAMGMSHTAIITTDGSCWCFGSNRFKQLGVSLEAEFACVQVYFIDDDEENNDNYDKNNDNNDNANNNVNNIHNNGNEINENGDMDAVMISCGDAFSVVALKDGSLWSWGKSSRGRLGRNNGVFNKHGIRHQRCAENNHLEKFLKSKLNDFYDEKPKECREFVERYMRNDCRPRRVESNGGCKGQVLSLCCNHGTSMVVIKTKD